MASVLTARHRDPSLVDCTNFAEMCSLGLSEASTFDPHSAEQGFRPVC
jgi:predicted nucleic acid-binding protein